MARRGGRRCWEKGGWGSVRWGLGSGSGPEPGGRTELRGGGLGGGGALAQGRVALLQRPLAHGAAGDARAGPVPLLVLHQDAAHQVLGAGQGDARGQLWAQTGQGQPGTRTPTPCPGSSPHTGYLSSGSMSSASPKMERQYSAILACCFALWGQGQRSEILRGRARSQGQRSQEPSNGPHGRLPLGCQGPQKPVLGDAGPDDRSAATHESTWFSKERMTG